MSACRYCSRPLDEAPSRACAGCREALHISCWEQLASQGVTGCGHDLFVADLTFVGPTRLLASDGTGAARLWQLAAGVDQPLRLAGEPVRGVLASEPADLLVLQGDTRVGLLSASNPAEARVVDAAGSYLSASAMTPDGSRLLAVSGAQLRGGDPRSPRFALDPLGVPFAEDVCRLALSPDGTRVAALLSSGSLVLRDAELGFDLGVSPTQTGPLGPIHGNACDALAFSADGSRLLLSSAGDVYVLDGLTAQLERRLELGGYASALFASADRRLLRVLSGPAQGPQITEHSHGGDPRRTLGPFAGLVLHVTSARFFDDTLAAVGSADGTVLLVDVARGAVRAHLRGHRNARWLLPSGPSRRLWALERAPEPSQVGVGAAGIWIFHTESAQLRLHRRGTGQVVAQRPLDEWPLGVGGLAQPEGDALLLQSSSGLVLVSEGGPPSPLSPQRAPEQMPFCAAGPQGVVCCDPWTLSLESFDERGASRWRVDRPQLSPLPGRPLGFDAAGSLLVLLKPSYGPGLAGLAQIDASGALRLRPPLDAPLSGVAEVGWLSPDGVHAIISRLNTPDDRRSELALFDLERGVFLGALAPGHRVAIRDLALSPLGTLVATCSSDHTARVWALPSGRQLAAFDAGEPLSAVRFGLDATTLYTWSDRGTLEAWDLTGLDRRADAFAVLQRGRVDPGPPRDLALRRFEAASREHDPECLAALLAFRSVYAAPWAPEPDEPWRQRAAERLRHDFDRRVRRHFPA